MTAKLTMLYSVTAALLLFLVSGLLYWILLRELEKETNQFLSSKLQILQNTLKETPFDAEDLQEETENQGDYIKFYARILDENGYVLQETSGMSSLTGNLPLKPEPAWERHIWKFKDNKSYRLAIANVKNESNQLQYVIQIVLDISQQQNVIANYRTKLGVVLFFGIFLVSFVGNQVARKGVAPLNQLARTAQSINISSLQNRMGNMQWPEELDNVVHEFDAMLDRLEDSFNRLSQFSADLAHEFRTPLNNIRGETEVVLARFRTSEEYIEVLGSNLEECEKLSSMVDNLLFLARAENVQTVIKKSELSAETEIKAVSEFYEPIAAEQQITITCEGSSLICAEQTLFRRALSNVLSNSLQSTPNGGKVMISINQDHGSFVDITIRDTGCGIRSEFLPKIFDRFCRGDQDNSNHKHGSGLGLAIVKSIMDLHQGKATIMSEIGKGTTVTLRFPFTVNSPQ
jgi:two-component system, OmpR family, heavy metal sensor histidine kinase CusS